VNKKEAKKTLFTGGCGTRLQNLAGPKVFGFAVGQAFFKKAALASP
jgi:hypothetical protein